MTRNLTALVVAALVCVALMAESASAVQSKCSSAKVKAAGKKAYKRANCYGKAVKKGVTVDSPCLTKVSDKFAAAFAKAETKGDCLTTSDASDIETDVDTFVDQVRSTVNANAAGPSKCDYKKIKYTGKKAYAKAKCHAKALSKDAAVDPTCLQKAEAKFAKQIAKAATLADCANNTDQTSALETIVDNFIDGLVAALVPPTTSTTTNTTSTNTTTTNTTTTNSTTTTNTSITLTSSTTTTTSNTTTTTSGGGPVTLKVTTVAGTGNCGGANLNPVPAAPAPGELDSDTGCTTKLNTCGPGGTTASSPCDLGLGCLYFGGGGNALVPPGGIPNNTTNFFTVTGGAIGPNNGTSPKTCSKGAGPARHCVSTNAMGACTIDGNCGANAGSCALDANCFFGPPLPIPNPSLPALSTCVVNVIQNDAGGTANPAGGSASISLLLSSRVYLTANSASPCPKCTSGNVCDPTWKTGTGGLSPDSGKACVATGTGSPTTIDCRPDLTTYVSALGVDLTPLTTGTATKPSDSSGLFCPGQSTLAGHQGAFGETGARCVKEPGMPSANLTDMAPHNGKLGSVFCIPGTGNAQLDGVADLPGPGAIGLNTTLQLQ